MATETLNYSFLIEILRLCFLRKSVIERLSATMKYQYMPSSELKKVYKDILDYFRINNDIPTFGILYEINKNDPSVLKVISEIKNCDIVDPQPVFGQLEDYIKNVRFTELWDNVLDIHKKGDRLAAIKMMADGSKEINEFSIYKDASLFSKVFKDFKKVQLEKSIRSESGDVMGKLPFGVLPCDIMSDGGMDKKDTALWILRSGVGKSTVLKWHGMWAARLGYDVLHVQAEGSAEEAFDKYTQIWSGLRYGAVKNGDFDEGTYVRLVKVAEKMVALGNEVNIVSYEKFDEVSMLDVRDLVIEFIKEHGKPPDELILDSIDLCHPGDGIHYGIDTQSIKMKLQNTARKFKNICNEFDLRGITATQTGDIPFEIWNDPDKFITRSNSMGDKNIANPFSFVFTGNQTLDEEKHNVLRIYSDKLRYYKTSARIHPIITDFDHGRFIDAAATRTVFSDIYGG